MNKFKIISSLMALAATAAIADAQSLAPSSIIGNTLLNSTITASAGGANGDGTFTDLLSVNGLDYTVTSANALTSPAPYSYFSSGGNVGVISESGVTVTLTFATANSGTFLADYGSGKNQTGTFSLSSLGVPTSQNAFAQGSSLVNVSNLLHLDAGTSSTVGFVIAGTAPMTVLVRASGPGLAQFGVTGALATPTITLDNAQGVSMATNTGWNNSTAIQTASAGVGAFSFAAGSADSAIILTLAPGAYTAQVKSSSPTDSGTVLVEAYSIP